MSRRCFLAWHLSWQMFANVHFRSVLLWFDLKFLRYIMSKLYYRQCIIENMTSPTKYDGHWTDPDLFSNALRRQLWHLPRGFWGRFKALEKSHIMLFLKLITTLPTRAWILAQPRDCLEGEQNQWCPLLKPSWDLDTLTRRKRLRWKWTSGRRDLRLHVGDTVRMQPILMATVIGLVYYFLGVAANAA